MNANSHLAIVLLAVLTFTSVSAHTRARTLHDLNSSVDSIGRKSPTSESNTYGTHPVSRHTREIAGNEKEEEDESNTDSHESTQAPVVIPTECSATNEGNAVHIAHESDCGLFYKCNHGEKVLQECPSGLAFNSVAQVCDWPEFAGCTPVDSNDFEDSTGTQIPIDESSTDSWTPESSGDAELVSSTENDLEIPSSTTEAPVVIPTECPSSNEGDTVHIAHESDCDLFYKCNHGEKVLQECPSGLAFNYVAQICDWPESAGCTPVDSNDFEDSTGTQIPLDESSTDSWTPESSGDAELVSSTENDLEIPSSTTEAPVVIPTECPSSNEGDTVHIAHESDCGLFYKCNHGKKVLQECPSGLAFNSVAQICDWPEFAGCTPVDSNDFEDSTGTQIPIDESSTDSWTPESSGDGELGSSTEHDFQIPSSTTEAPVVIPTECPSSNEGDTVHIAHESDCGLFYKCNHGEKVLQECPSGLAFNSVAQICDWPESAGCTPVDSNDFEDSTGTQIPIDESSTDSWTPESSADGELDSSTENDLEIPSSTTEAPVVIPTECPSTNEVDTVHIAHESDCGLFYKCNHGEKVLQECPSGLAFNSVAQVCDWPEFAGCTPVDSNDFEDSTGTQIPIDESSTDSWTPESSGDDELHSNTENDLEIPSSTTEAPVVIPTECPSTNEGDTVHIAHESDCSRFYICNHGQKIVMQCPKGLEFNAKQKVCDWPEGALCSVSSSEARIILLHDDA